MSTADPRARTSGWTFLRRRLIEVEAGCIRVREIILKCVLRTRRKNYYSVLEVGLKQLYSLPNLVRYVEGWLVAPRIGTALDQRLNHGFSDIVEVPHGSLATSSSSSAFEAKGD